MSKQSNPQYYLTFTKQQGDNFLKEVEKIVKDILTQIGKQDSIHEYENNKFNKYLFFVDTINGTKSPLSNYYFLRKDIFNPLSQNIDYECKAISYKTIEKFMVDYFSNYDLHNPENNAIDIGKLEKITLKEIEERNNIVKQTTQFADKLEVVSKSSLDQNFIKKRLEEYDWALFTYGEKIVEDQQGVSTRIFYVKERPVQFKDLKITLKNTDSAKIIPRQDVKNRKGIILTESNPIYHGDYRIFERHNGLESILYLETEALNGGNNRHFRLVLALGKGIDEIGLGTFTLIKDLGPLLSGTALLVKKENKEDKKIYFDNNKCRLYNSFKDDENTVPRPVRVLLEKRSRAYVKLPRVLSHYTLNNLEDYLFEQKRKEREYYESREVIIHRKDAFISIPLNCNGADTAKEYEVLLKKSVKILASTPFNLRRLTYGTKKNHKVRGNLIESPDKTEEHESNFDKILQSNLVIFIYPEIKFPYESEGEDENNENNHISTAFMEMGFAIGLRKKILILTSEKVFKTFPSIVKKFAETKFVEIIKCELNSETSLAKSFKTNKRIIMDFLDAHLDYKIIEE